MRVSKSVPGARPNSVVLDPRVDGRGLFKPKPLEATRDAQGVGGRDAVAESEHAVDAEPATN